MRRERGRLRTGHADTANEAGIGQDFGDLTGSAWPKGLRATADLATIIPNEIVLKLLN